MMAKVSMRFWVLSDRDLLAALRRVAAGEDLDIVYAELYANTAHADSERVIVAPPHEHDVQ